MLLLLPGENVNKTSDYDKGNNGWGRAYYSRCPYWEMDVGVCSGVGGGGGGSGVGGRRPQTLSPA